MKFEHFDLLHADEFNPKHLELVTHAQLKCNGLRLLITRQPAEHLVRTEITAVTREGKTNLWLDLAQQDSIKDRLAALPMWTALDCEVHIPGVPETSIKTLLRQGDPRITITPFAVPVFGGKDMRPAPFEEVFNLIRTLGFEPPETVCGGLDMEDVEGLLEQARQRSIEGWVLKAAHYRGWWKLKPVKTFDAVVTRILPGEGRHFGRMGAVEVGLYDQDGNLSPVGNVGSGFTDVERTHIWQNPQGTVGRVVEVAYDSLAANGAPKFPRFKRFRDDKEAHQCSMKQIRV